MANWRPIPLASQTYEAESLPASAQRLVNMYPEPLPDGASGSMLLCPSPGLKSFATVGSGPIRGLIATRGYLFAVSGSELYRVDQTGVAVNIGGDIGGAGQCHLIDNGYQVGIACSSGFYSAEDGVVQVSVTPYNGATYQDGYGILSRIGSERFDLTNLDDFSVISGIDFSTADVFADNLVGCVSDHRELWLFGKDTSEIWYNSGEATFPFTRIPSGFLEIGCAAGGTIAKTSHHVVWLGSDLSVYRSVGYQPQRISTPAIDLLLAEQSGIGDATAAVYQWRGHTFYVITLKDRSLVYDFLTQRWHERASFGEGHWIGRHQAQIGATCYVTDRTDPTIYTLDADTHSDNGEPIEHIVTSGHLDAGGDWAVMDEVELLAETGPGTGGDDAKIYLECSDDGGKTWGNRREASLGAVGQYKTQVKWSRLGRFRQRILRFSSRENVRMHSTGCRARIS